MGRSNPSEKILWSIALPGFGQFLNGKLVKGIVLIFLEFLINVQANLNAVIIPSFHGDIQTAIHLTNYQWLMFYPCIYMFAIWDAYRDAGGGSGSFSYLPFVISAFFGTIGVIYSSSFKLFGFLWGPIFLPILLLIVGVGVGHLVRLILLKLS
ncbi:hypothetical protein [Oceanobacillus saliphilus]|uniref:hypothetical protein n=1 Tax=Oceanobacillus saliphilus TaxID=2925834 RepID=UPI00201DC75C|nr:hypothetical protein [Oceanobacillus saliphilus]